jgi:hypothetical protein
MTTDNAMAGKFQNSKSCDCGGGEI